MAAGNGGNEGMHVCTCMHIIWQFHVHPEMFLLLSLIGWRYYSNIGKDPRKPGISRPRKLLSRGGPAGGNGNLHGANASWRQRGQGC